MSALAGQARALLWLRFTLLQRRFSEKRSWLRLALQLVLLLGLLGLSAASSWLIVSAADHFGHLRHHGDPRPTLSSWLFIVLGVRVYLLLVGRAAGGTFLEPRTFLSYAVPPALVSALNYGATLVEPGWLVTYPPLAAIAVAAQRLSVAPWWSMLPGELMLVLLLAALVQLGTVLLGALSSRRGAARALAVLVALSFAWAIRGLSAGLARTGKTGEPALRLEDVPAPLRAPVDAVLVVAQALAQGALLSALSLLALAAALAGLALFVAHRVSLREARRPEEAVAGKARPGQRGWRLPLLPGPLSALVEKEAKTLLRAGWLQLLLAPILFFLLRFTQGGPGGLPLGPEPLLVVAAYAHLGVVAFASNGFGYDLAAARAYFLWPVSLRQAVAAKNAVAYLFSLGLFVLMSAAYALGAHLRPEQVAVGLVAHAATFPLLAMLGNFVSAIAPAPMRSLRTRRSGPGASVALLRIGTLLVVLAAGWAPYGIAKFTGLPVLAAYLGELLAMGIAYGGLLAVSVSVLEGRRETLLRALAQDE